MNITESTQNPSMAAILPTHNPTIETYNFIKSLVKWYPQLQIVVVDDLSTLDGEVKSTVASIKKLSNQGKITYLRTDQNVLKAGALNFGLAYLASQPQKPEVIFTLDDDVKVSPTTLTIMAENLLAQPTTGAVCSLAIALNKKANILTRLQSLEYHSFNMTKIADNQFLKGPLVMQGMLTAFRTKALLQANGFTNNHLIEDYDITARLKQNGWKVRIANKAEAWTEVPETLEGLWKQRVRWSYGGLHVATAFWRRPVSIFQDLVGHALFLVMMALIIGSFLTPHAQDLSVDTLVFLLIVTFTTIAVGLVYNLVSLLTLPNRDRVDWVLKLTILPEFIYSNILSLVLIGSYLFLAYNLLGKKVLAHIWGLATVYALGLALFQRIGYSSSWGTKQLSLSKEVV